jgi:hypothetical protein
VRRFTCLPSGITMRLQRIGMGLILALVAVAAAALVEMRRLGVAKNTGMMCWAESTTYLADHDRSNPTKPSTNLSGITAVEN